jgi:hypothetical protein
MLVSPRAFGHNPETATSNVFQRRPSAAETATLAERARAELDRAADRLLARGIAVAAVEDRSDPPSPDAAFPNNWVTFHADGTVVLYPMAAASRRAEVRPEAVDEVARRLGRRVVRVLDWSGETRALEGTGSLVLDRPARVAFACPSSRTHPALLDRFAREMAYEVVSFRAEVGGRAVYHTNVVLCVGSTVAIACLDALPDRREAARLAERLEATGHEVVTVSLDQAMRFAANALEVESEGGDPCLVVSETAAAALGRSQRARLERHADLVTLAIPTIEAVGGGSARCLLAEVHLPPAP